MVSNEYILHIDGLCLKNRDGKVLVDDFSMQLRPGESIGLVGESGSGKTLSLRSVIGLLPDGIKETCDKKSIVGNCAMIFQNPLSALDPLCPVLKQLTEIVMLRQKKDRSAARETAVELWRRLSLPEDAIERDRYPGELSGGQCQRVVIAIALACKPDILLCDEPTTALDVTVQKQTIQLIRELQAELGFAIIFVTHNLAVAADICSSLCVMQNGKIIERGGTEEVLRCPKHPYTKMLISSILRIPDRQEDSEV